MGDEDFIRQSSDHFVTTERRVPRDPPRRRDEERKKQQPTGLEGCAAFGWDPHPLDHPRRADDDGLFPRRRMRRHSCSMGDWNPLMTVTPKSRNRRAVSCAFRMASPGVRAEQKSAVLGGVSKSLLPRRASCDGASTPNRSRKREAYRASELHIVLNVIARTFVTPVIVNKPYES